jgi:hypothetical protein
MERIPLDNQFHYGNTPHPGRISSYSDLNYYQLDGRISRTVEYSTQSEDKEYIGNIDNYVPHRGGIVRGSVYCLSPKKQIIVYGLASGLTLDVNIGNGVQFYYNQSGQLTTNGDHSRLTVLSDTSFSYLMTKEELIHKLYESVICNWDYNGHGNPFARNLVPTNFKFAAYPPRSEWCVCRKENGDEAVGITTVGDYTVFRNEISDCEINIPPQGEDIDTGFEFDVVDDGNEDDGSWIRLSKNEGYLENPTDSDNVVLTWDYNSGYTRYAFLNYNVEIKKTGAQINDEYSFWLRQEGDLGDDPSIPQNIKELMEEEQPWQPVEDEEVITDWDEYLERRASDGLSLFRIKISNADLAKNGGAMQITAYNMFNGTWSMSLTDVDPKTLDPNS